MKEKTLSVSCTYSEAGPLVVDLIRESFRFFLKKNWLPWIFARRCSMVVAMNGRLSQEV